MKDAGFGSVRSIRHSIRLLPIKGEHLKPTLFRPCVFYLSLSLLHPRPFVRFHALAFASRPAKVDRLAVASFHDPNILKQVSFPRKE